MARELGIPADAFVIGSVGRLSDVKGYDRLVRTFSDIVHGDSAAPALRLPNRDRENPVHAGRNPTAGAVLVGGEAYTDDNARELRRGRPIRAGPGVGARRSSYRPSRMRSKGHLLARQRSLPKVEEV